MKSQPLRKPKRNATRKKAQPYFLLIDVSNSFTKLALASRAKLLEVKKIPTPGLTAKALKKAAGSWEFDTAVVSSVVPKTQKALKKFLKKKKTLTVGPDLDLGVGIDYPKPASIGADRLANAASVVALFGAPAVVVDFGTAVT
ncbi:MAG TPA: type III pantothenate kinase, partial [Chthoniobacteraceae bacterium]|nr:type III pantothenate kinase [Chthoniobacteraceae bacterium]